MTQVASQYNHAVTRAAHQFQHFLGQGRWNSPAPRGEVGHGLVLANGPDSCRKSNGCHFWARTSSPYEKTLQSPDFSAPAIAEVYLDV